MVVESGLKMLLESCGAWGCNGAACTIRSGARMMEKRRSGAEFMGEAIKKFRLGVIVAKYVDILLKFLYVL